MANNKYLTHVKPNFWYIAEWLEQGKTNDEISTLLGVSRASFQSYIKKYLELRDMIENGKDVANRLVERSLFDGAIGYTVVVREPVKLRTTEYVDGKKVKEVESVEFVDKEVYIQPNPTEKIFWLKNRDSARWGSNAAFEAAEDVDSSVREVSLEDVLEDGC